MAKRVLKLLTLCIVCIIAFSSCSPIYYQIYETEPISTDIVSDGESILYENNDCKIVYDFWCNGGNSSFAFYNKTEKNIYLDLSETFFVSNGIAYDYYQGKEYTSNSYNSMSTSNFMENRYFAFVKYNNGLYYGNHDYSELISPMGNINGITNISGNSYSIMRPEKEIICVPPKTLKIIFGFTLNKEIFAACPLEVKNYDIKNGNNNHTYTLEQNTPLIFGNIVTYSFNKQAKDPITVKNDFYIKMISNFREQDILTKEFISDNPCNPTSGTQKKLKYFFKPNVKKANKFYIEYKK